MGVKIKEVSKEDANDIMDLIYIESESGFHFAIDATYLDQVGNFIMVLPTGEVISTKELDKNLVGSN